jgi:hypothetical protein
MCTGDVCWYGIFTNDQTCCYFLSNLKVSCSLLPWQAADSLGLGFKTFVVIIYILKFSCC